MPGPDNIQIALAWSLLGGRLQYLATCVLTYRDCAWQEFFFFGCPAAECLDSHPVIARFFWQESRCFPLSFCRVLGPPHPDIHTLRPAGFMVIGWFCCRVPGHPCPHIPTMCPTGGSFCCPAAKCLDSHALTYPGCACGKLCLSAVLLQSAWPSAP